MAGIHKTETNDKLSSIPEQHLTDFAAIDFETANGEVSSVCSVGVVIVKNDVMVDQYYSLIQPEPNFYNYWNTKIHGIVKADTENERVFPFVWEEIAPKIRNLPLIAHNKAFDERCLKAVFRVYQMDYPDYRFYCTCVGSRKLLPDLPNHQLQTVAGHFGYDLTMHHHALADAEACAIIAMNLF